MEQRATRTVRNRDIILIQSVRYIKLDIESLEERQAWENQRLFHITQNLASVVVKGGSSWGMDEAMATLQELSYKHEQTMKLYKRTLGQAERIINQIPSRQMRTLVTMLYLDGASDNDARKALGMSRWVFENARNTVENAERMADVKWHDRYTEK